MAKALGLDDLHTYVVEHSTPPDEILERLTARTVEAAGVFARMQIAPEQGAFMTWLTRLIGAGQVLEIGTFTGYSAICIARGLSAEGRLVCLDISDEWTSIGREAWRGAGCADGRGLRVGTLLFRWEFVCHSDTSLIGFTVGAPCPPSAGRLDQSWHAGIVCHLDCACKTQRPAVGRNTFTGYNQSGLRQKTVNIDTQN